MSGTRGFYSLRRRRRALDHGRSKWPATAPCGPQRSTIRTDLPLIAASGSPALIRPSPDTAPQLAERAVAFVQRKFGLLLPYNPPSLILVDALVDKIRATGASEEQARGLLLELGCYVGEVFVRHTRATWRLTAEMGMSKVCAFPMVVALPGPVGCNAIGKVFDRFRTGESASVAALYQTALGPPQ